MLHLGRGLLSLSIPSDLGTSGQLDYRTLGIVCSVVANMQERRIVPIIVTPSQVTTSIRS